MTRTEAIDQITSQLSALDDDRVMTVALIVAQLAGGNDLTRALTARELQLIAQSKQDFREGRVLSSEELRAALDIELASYGVPTCSA